MEEIPLALNVGCLMTHAKLSAANKDVIHLFIVQCPQQILVIAGLNRKFWMEMSLQEILQDGQNVLHTTMM